MRSIKKFLTDFVGFYFIILGTFFVGLFEIVTQIIFALQKLWYGVLLPNLVELFADVFFMSLILYQSYLSCSSNICLSLSKIFLRLAEYSHKRSEEVIERTWTNV